MLNSVVPANSFILSAIELSLKSSDAAFMINALALVVFKSSNDVPSPSTIVGLSIVKFKNGLPTCSPFRFTKTSCFPPSCVAKSLPSSTSINFPYVPYSGFQCGLNLLALNSKLSHSSNPSSFIVNVAFPSAISWPVTPSAAVIASVGTKLLSMSLNEAIIPSRSS